MSSIYVVHVSRHETQRGFTQEITSIPVTWHRKKDGHRSTNTYHERERPLQTNLCSFNVNFCKTPTTSWWDWLLKDSLTGLTVPSNKHADKRFRTKSWLTPDSVRRSLPSMTAYCRTSPGVAFKRFLSFSSIVTCGALWKQTKQFIHLLANVTEICRDFWNTIKM